MEKMAAYKNKFLPILVTLITLIIAIGYMSVYLSGEIRGNINWHFLPGEMFGVPAPLAEKGLTPLYHGYGITGWDGQFYYYISNDLVGTAETTKHIDADAYRYQRVGLSALARIVSVITFQKWVSPLTFYLTNLCLVLLATYIWSSYLSKNNYSPFLALFWSLGLGTQLTVLNGLPDAAADSCIIMALVFYLRRWPIPYTIAMTFAVFSREIYLIVPTVLGCIALWDWLSTKPKKISDFLKIGLTHGTPIVLWCSWWVYLVLHFHHTPSSQAFNILGLPFASWLYYVYCFHYIFGLLNWISLFLFMGLLIISLSLIYKALFKQKNKNLTDLRNICLAFLPICLLYLCFGKTVMMHYSGFMKAATIFFFFIPLTYVLSKELLPKPLIIFLIMVTIYFMGYICRDRVLPAPASTLYQYATYTNDMKVDDKPVACLKNPRSKLELISMEDFYYQSIFRRLRGLSDAKILTVRVKNLSDDTYQITNGSGAVRLSYQWLSDNGGVIEDGIRGHILVALKPSQDVTMPMTVKFPRKPGKYILVISLVQEGCTWFYLANDPGVIKLKYNIHD